MEIFKYIDDLKILDINIVHLFTGCMSSLGLIDIFNIIENPPKN